MKRLSAFLLLLAMPLAADTIVSLSTPLPRPSTPSVTLLDDGRALITGGSASSGAIDLFDPSTGAFTRSHAETALPRVAPTATLLDDGRVLIAGGGYRTDGRPLFGNYGDVALELYDPATDRITRAANMNAARFEHTATLLDDGTVLLAGGEEDNIGGFHYYRQLTNSADVFNPVTGMVRAVGPMLAKRSEHSATKLADGRVLIFGGTSEPPFAEIYDPATSAFTPLSVSETRSRHTATLLTDGRVLLVGGENGAGVSVLDPATGAIHALRANVGPRSRHTAIGLDGDRVLIFGGADESLILDASVDAVVSRFRVMTTPFERAGAARLGGGKVLIYGDGAWLYIVAGKRRAVTRATALHDHFMYEATSAAKSSLFFSMPSPSL